MHKEKIKSTEEIYNKIIVAANLSEEKLVFIFMLF